MFIYLLYLIIQLIYQNPDTTEIPKRRYELWFKQEDGSYINQDTTKMIIPSPDSKIIYYKEPTYHRI